MRMIGWARLSRLIDVIDKWGYPMSRLVAAVAASAIFLSAAPAIASNVKGTVVAYDRVAKRLVLSDKTVFSIEADSAEVPDSLTAGDEVEIDFESGEDGVDKINSITIITEEEDS
jgi:hypothetical protein